MVNEIPQEERIFDPRNGCLMAAFGAIPLLFFAVASMTLTIGCTGIGEGTPPTACGHHPLLILILFPGSPAAVVLGLALTVARKRWRWFGAGILVALACLALPVIP
jgi:hypothetical protein